MLGTTEVTPSHRLLPLPECLLPLSEGNVGQPQIAGPLSVPRSSSCTTHGGNFGQRFLNSLTSLPIQLWRQESGRSLDMSPEWLGWTSVLYEKWVSATT